MRKVEFWLDITPVPQERLRFSIRGRGKRMKIFPFIPEKTRNFQNDIREMVQGFMEEEGLEEFGKTVPLSLSLVFYLPKPKSVKRKMPTVRPDLSNYLKAIEDGLQRKTATSDPALMEDDSSICRITAEKRYVNEDFPDPGIEVILTEFEEG